MQEQVHKDSYKFGSFVANRISEIQENSKNVNWLWTESRQNVADVTSRPLDIKGLNEYWKHGPQYLSRDFKHWPVDKEIDYLSESPDIKGKY